MRNHPPSHRFAKGASIGAMTLSARVERFIVQMARELRVVDLTSLPIVSDQPPLEAVRVSIEDPSRLTLRETSALAAGFNGRFAMVAFECRDTEFHGAHPLTLIGEQLREFIPTRWGVISAPFEPDGTTKIRDVGDPNPPSRTLTSEAMAAHQDGWLSLRSKPGVIAVTGLWADTVGIEPAATFSQNTLRLSLELLKSDEAAFAALFADDAVKIVDRSGKVAVIAPVLTIGPGGGPQVFFRGRNDEYDVLPGANDAATRRAIEFLSAFTSFGSNGSVFTHLDRRGRGLLLNNRHCIHGRTAFRDGAAPHQKRVIASKWWTSDDDQALVWV